MRRDLEALQAAGFDVAAHATQRGKVWKLGPRAKSTHKITATATELMALSLGRDLLYPLFGTPFWQGIESFWNKVRDELPASVADHYEKYRRVLYVLGMPAKSYASKQGILKTLHRAILEHRVVEVDYQPPGRPAARGASNPTPSCSISPACTSSRPPRKSRPDQERLRHWKLDRFQRATILDEWFHAGSRLPPGRIPGAQPGDLLGRPAEELPDPHQCPCGTLGAGRSRGIPSSRSSRGATAASN